MFLIIVPSQMALQYKFNSQNPLSTSYTFFLHVYLMSFISAAEWSRQTGPSFLAFLPVEHAEHYLLKSPEISWLCLIVIKLNYFLRGIFFFLWLGNEATTSKIYFMYIFVNLTMHKNLSLYSMFFFLSREQKPGFLASTLN